MRSWPKASLPPKWCIDKRWWQPICELIGELMKEEMPARWAQPLPGGNRAPHALPGCSLHTSVFLAHCLHTSCTLLSANTGCDPNMARGVSGKKVCATRSCPTPPSLPLATSPATSTKHFLPTAKNLALAIRRLKSNHEKGWQLCKLQNRKCFITTLTIN